MTELSLDFKKQGGLLPGHCDRLSDWTSPHAGLYE
ncbi:Uncharacterised protein [Streptococcus macacae NCTC 11558]|nr:Uncharacterised protein [Streptococcus macacae NCTC 11558]